MAEVIDLGHGHSLTWLSWAPDRSLNPQYKHLPDVERYGAIIRHPAKKPGVCGGCAAIHFDGPVQRELGEKVTWKIESWEPLTLSPSLLCACGDHGFIREGRWVPA